MVRCLAFIFLFACSSLSWGRQVDTLLGSAVEPAYVRAVAPRFAKWMLQNYELVPSQSRKPWKDLLVAESGLLNEWTFSPWSDFSWPRLQFGLRFKNGTEKEAYIFILPTDTKRSLEVIKKYLKLTPDLQRNWLGFGFSLHSSEVCIYNLETRPEVVQKLKALTPEISGQSFIRQTVFLNGKIIETFFLSELKPSRAPSLAFSPLVASWRAWFDPEGRLVSYELSLEEFNLHFLDGASVGAARKINREFILSNLRILYRASDDYDILYP